MSARYAIYFAPEQGSPWWTFGSHWLGRDECLDVPLAQPRLPTITPDPLHAITLQPRRYGFHATLKAPFPLRAGHTQTDVLKRLQALASQLKPLALGPLQAVAMGDFVALGPTAANAELMALAARCVAELDDLRAPLSEADLARRRVAHLDERGRALLHRYGYPYVMDRFRFHFTLSGPVALPIAQLLIDSATDAVADLNAQAPLQLDRLCLFVEPGPGEPFKRIGDAVLGA